MAGSASVLEDGSRFSALDRNLLIIERWLALVSGVA
ncbi:MAG: TRAP transporter small permease, partial [Pseudomonadota bacterium]